MAFYCIHSVQYILSSTEMYAYCTMKRTGNSECSEFNKEVKKHTINCYVVTKFYSLQVHKLSLLTVTVSWQSCVIYEYEYS